MMTAILQLAKDQLTLHANPCGTYVDFTMGRGRDTLFLCRLAPRGTVYAFDVQAEALAATRGLLASEGMDNYTLIQDSHDRFLSYVDGPIDGGLFNLGYLPGGDRSRTTLRDTTLAAVTGAVGALTPGGVLGVAVYPGHSEGEAEGILLERFAAALPRDRFDAVLHRILNVPESPYMLLFQRRP